MKEDIKQEFLSAYEQYADAIYRHCAFRVFSRERAEELTQETFMRGWEYLKRGNKVENLRALLYRIATNLLIDESRRKKSESLDTLLEAGDFFEPAGDARQETESLLVFKEVRSVMERLRPEEQTLITMRYVDDLTPSEIAKILHSNPNTVSVKIYRALKTLKSMVPRQ